MTPRLLTEDAARAYLGGIDPRKLCAPRLAGLPNLTETSRTTHKHDAVFGRSLGALFAVRVRSLPSCAVCNKLKHIAVNEPPLRPCKPSMTEVRVNHECRLSP